MRATFRFVNHFVNQVQLFEARRGNAQSLSRIRCFGGILPQNGRATFRRNHRIGAVTQHHQMIAHANRQRPTRTTFANHQTDNRRGQIGHDEQIARNRFTLTALFGIHARKRARRVDQGQHRQFETRRRFQQTLGLAIAFGARHAEVAPGTLTGITTFLMTNHHQRAAINPRQATNQRRIVSKGTVAMQFDKIGHQMFDVIQGVRALRMARHLRHLPGTQLAENRARQLA